MAYFEDETLRNTIIFVKIAKPLNFSGKFVK